MSGFDIGKRHVGGEAPCFIMAEVGMAHDGSLGMAHAYIDGVASAGADAVKFQCHIAEAESTPEEPWRVCPEWPQDENRYAYWQRTAFTQDQWWSLKAHAHEKGLEFLCSPFSVEAVHLLDGMVDAWKVPSGEVGNHLLLDAILKTCKPVLLSVGMSTCVERDDLARYMFKRAGPRFIILNCTSLYPCPPEKVGLHEMRDGLSDHSGTIWPALGAAALGASIVEVHVCFSKGQFGFDTSSSVTLEDLADLVEGVRFIEKALTPVDKDAIARELAPMRELFMEKHKRKASA